MSRSRLILIIVIAALVLIAAGVGIFLLTQKNEDTAGETVAEDVGSTTEETVTPPTADTDTDGDADTDTDEAPATPATPSTVTVKVYWVQNGDRAVALSHELPYTQAVGGAAMKELLAGPTAADMATQGGLSSAIPDGTKLLGLTISGGVAKVDLSGEFDDGGGSFSVTARLAQVVYTLCQFPTVDSVEFYMDGVKVELFSGEGLILDGPQTPADYASLLPIDE